VAIKKSPTDLAIGAFRYHNCWAGLKTDDMLDIWNLKLRVKIEKTILFFLPTTFKTDYRPRTFQGFAAIFALSPIQWSCMMIYAAL